MSRASLRSEPSASGRAVAPMCEHDLLEVVEIEETTGLSQWGWDAYRAELARPEAVMLVARRACADVSVGRALLCSALDNASARGARLAVLEVRAGNLAARSMYERVGFKVVGERRNYYRQPVEDALVMTMRLAPEA